MKKLIYKDNELEVYKTKNKKSPYLLILDNHEMARFNCPSDDDVAFALPVIFEHLHKFISKQPDTDINEFNFNFDSDLGMQVKTAMHYH